MAHFNIVFDYIIFITMRLNGRPMNEDIECYDCREFGVCHEGAERRIGFFLCHTFSMMALISAIEPLRAANRFSGRPLYSWHCFTADGLPAHACNGMQHPIDSKLSKAKELDAIFVCGPHNPLNYYNKHVFAELKRLARQVTLLGALDTGTYLLARAGLMEGRRCTLHWENIPGFREEFPKLHISTELYEYDQDRLTCAGGTAALDMGLHLVTIQQGAHLAQQASELFIHDVIRESHHPQRMDLCIRTGVHDPRLLDIIAIMEANCEQPLTVSEIANAVELSIRQVERLFQRYLRTTPIRFYLDCRMEKARKLIDQTSRSIIDIALQTGFVSASHFSQRFRMHFGLTPRQYRNT